MISSKASDYTRLRDLSKTVINIQVYLSFKAASASFPKPSMNTLPHDAQLESIVKTSSPQIRIGERNGLDLISPSPPALTSAASYGGCTQIIMFGLPGHDNTPNITRVIPASIRLSGRPKVQ